jgi:flagellin
MSSILTNMSAMSAVANLAATQKSLAQTQNQISTGLKVSSASDNAAYWSIATTMKSQTGELSAVSDALNLGTSVLGTATAALNTTIGIIQKMQSDVISAQTSGVDAGTVQTDIAALQKQLTQTVNSASFNNVNLLDASTVTAGTTGSQSIVSSVSGLGTSNFSVGTISISYSDTALVSVSGASSAAGAGVLDSAISGFTGSVLTFSVTSASNATDFSNLSKALDSALAKIQTVAAKLGATTTNVSLQSSFVSALSDSITTGIGSLVDADMNEASTRLSALQTQQQLGIQALSVANQNSQIILKLFGG